MDLSLSVLDLSPVGSGSTATRALRNTPNRWSQDWQKRARWITGSSEFTLLSWPQASVRGIRHSLARAPLGYESCTGYVGYPVRGRGIVGFAKHAFSERRSPCPGSF